LGVQQAKDGHSSCEKEAGRHGEWRAGEWKAETSEREAALQVRERVIY